MSLSIHDRHDGDFHVITLTGDIDIETARDLRAHFIEHVTDPASRVVVDMSGVEFMDSSGLGALVGGWQILRDTGELRVAGALPAVERVFRLTGMHEVFPLFPDVAAATTA
ncbi:hypothetical protein ASD11_10035 [Aeromicrobium sp. Root495]|uniref:STAS domain-containing protein n=1 Tax=Aeromicrobium sp. Root495 TaxID=1736550 RepID=UPI0006FF7E8B|nr:STAS domain-containing protein [Aeromicrobium sp. Root495]KQY59853.1 hypothetical protein ASD11_10035 [Aeromicrobium sp. Root495]